MYVNQPPTVATPAAANPNPISGTTAALSVLGADDGGESNLTYTWAATGTPPAPFSFSVNGTNGSKNTTATFTKAGNYSFQVTITDAGGLSTTSAVNVTVDQTLTAITVSPGAATLNENASQQFTATAYDQFGNALATQPAFTWAMAGGVGSVNASGLYTSPGTPGSASISATSGSMSGSATVTVVPASQALIVVVPGPQNAQPIGIVFSPATGNSIAISDAAVGNNSNPSHRYCD